MSKFDVICMIPARIGSQRFKQKNLALIDNKSVLEWGINAAKNSGAFDKIIVNGDDLLFEHISKKNNIEFYRRNKLLAQSSTKSDEVIMDFIDNFSCKYLVWFNAIAPLQEINDIRKFVEELLRNKYQSLFAVKTQNIQTLFEDKPLNFDYEKKFERTQDLKPSRIFIPSLMGWDIDSFRNDYHKNNYGFFCGNTGYFEVSLLSTLVIKKEEDFKMIRSVIEGYDSYNRPIKYYSS